MTRCRSRGTTKQVARCRSRGNVGRVLAVEVHGNYASRKDLNDAFKESLSEVKEHEFIDHREQRQGNGSQGTQPHPFHVLAQ
jgi:hypothetical protein